MSEGQNSQRLAPWKTFSHRFSWVAPKPQNAGEICDAQLSPSPKWEKPQKLSRSRCIINPNAFLAAFRLFLNRRISWPKRKRLFWRWGAINREREREKTHTNFRLVQGFFFCTSKEYVILLLEIYVVFFWFGKENLDVFLKCIFCNQRLSMLDDVEWCLCCLVSQ